MRLSERFTVLPRRILNEHAVAAGLPPRIDVLDEIASQLSFDEQWQTDLDALLTDAEHDTDLADAMLTLRANKVNQTHLRQLAIALSSNWDRVEEWGPPLPQPVPQLQIDELVRTIDRLNTIADGIAAAVPDDSLVQRLREVRAWGEQLVLANRFERIRLIGETKGLSNRGNQKVWKNGLKEEVHTAWDHAYGEVVRQRQRVLDAAISQLACVVGQRVVAAAHRRHGDGRLVFHDLLVLARRVLTDTDHGPAVRTSLHERYQRLLLDEFQDTDPIQLELAQLITAAPDDHDAVPLAGRLFVVGDPKQSIYRFRRADISMYLQAQETIGAELVQLTANFRSTEPIIDWVNFVFDGLIKYRPDAQAAFTRLDATRAAAPAGPHVVRFGEERSGTGIAGDVREAEALDIVSLIRESASWMVRDEHGDWRSARLRDVAILLPTRISLPQLEDALTDAAIPYRTESSSLVYATREIRDLMLALRAVEDPTDELALVESLRTALFGCSDVDLVRWKFQRGGRWNLTATSIPEPLPDEGDDPVRDAFITLRRLHENRRWRTPAQLLDELLRERRCFEVAALGSRYRDVWRRLRFVSDQARAWSDSGGITMRDYLRWVSEQGRDGARVAEAVLPETDDDAVRILTVHAAKGLEFPIVIVGGLSTARTGGRGRVQVRWHDHRPEVSFRSTVTTSDYDAAYQLDEQMDHEERLRLLYVACTRASDHLCVSVHRARVAKEQSEANASSATLLFGASAMGVVQRDGTVPTMLGAAVGTQTRPVSGSVFDDATFEADRAAVHERAGRRLTVSPSGLAALGGGLGGDVRDDDVAPTVWPPPGLVKDARSLELPAWNRGRYGTAIGRAVHAVLQRVDLTTGDGIDEAAAAQAAGEGILGKESTIAQLARSALTAQTIQAAAGAQQWRELYVGTTVGDVVLEGYVDLLYRTDDGFVVVDYKTDAVTDDDLDATVSRYRLQGAAYALALEQVTGEPVVACDFVFCRPDGAVERRLGDLAEAKAEVFALLTDGQALAVTPFAPSTTPIV